MVEAAVIGAPDQLRGEVIEAFVALRPGAERAAVISGPGVAEEALVMVALWVCPSRG